MRSLICAAMALVTTTAGAETTYVLVVTLLGPPETKISYLAFNRAQCEQLKYGSLRAVIKRGYPANSIRHECIPVVAPPSEWLDDDR
jgi:hypothetical protein